MKKFDLLAPSSSGSDDSEIPYEVVKLPSRGLLYDEEHPLYNCESVEIRAMNTKDENILASQALIKNGTVINVLLRNCLVNKSVDPQSLLLGDKAAIVLAIRISGFTAEYKVQTVCPFCNNKFNHKFDLSKCEYKFLEENPVEANKNLFEYVLPKTGRKVLFSLLTDCEEDGIMKAQINRKRTVGSEVDELVTDRLITQIKQIDGIKEKDKIAKIVHSMSIIDSRSLRQHILQISPDIIMEQEVFCKSCGQEETHSIPMGIEFFWPRIGSTKK